MHSNLINPKADGVVKLTFNEFAKVLLILPSESVSSFNIVPTAKNPHYRQIMYSGRMITFITYKLCFIVQASIVA